MLLTNFVRELQQLNDIEITLPEIPIEEIMNDPESYAINFMESVFQSNEDKFVKAYNKGKKFALELKGLKRIKDELYYLDSKPVDKKLPEAYQLGNTLQSLNQMCSNCKFYADDYCIKWDADVRDKYWCKSWQK